MKLAGPHWLKTDEEITRLLQEMYPPLDDPAAQAAIVARFSDRARRRQVGARKRARDLSIASIVLAPALILVWRYGGPWIGQRLARGGKRRSIR